MVADERMLKIAVTEEEINNLGCSSTELEDKVRHRVSFALPLKPNRSRKEVVEDYYTLLSAYLLSSY